jgi:hypothetical protein
MAEDGLVIHVIPHEDPVNLYYPSSKLVSVDERLITNTADMVDLVVKVSQTEKKKVKLLTITGHGNPDGFYIGNDWVTVADLIFADKRIYKKLQELRLVLAPDARVVLRACDVGESEGLLKAFSGALGGARVQGSSWKQLGPIPGLVGPVIECTLTTCKTVEPPIRKRTAEDNLPARWK